MKIRSLKLPPDLDRRLEEYARERGSSLSSVVREAVEVYLTRQAPADEQSALARAAELSGLLDGAHDLSINPDHLRGYGAAGDERPEAGTRRSASKPRAGAAWGGRPTTRRSHR